MNMMKALAVLLLVAASPAAAQDAVDITGRWNGMLAVQGTHLRLVFHIEKSGDGYSATFDSPDQGAQGIPVSTTTFANPVLTFELTNIGARYDGTVSGDSIVGTWKQGLRSLPLTLSRNEVSGEEVNRPQEPVRPYPYIEDEVRVENDLAGVTLACTLTRPSGDGPQPAAVLATGSGPQNRNEEVFGHKPFLVLADHLTRRGIAVLRCDDRGTGESTGDFSTATSRDFATDLASAVAWLETRPEISTNRIGLIGHSEGALVATRVAADNGEIAYLVLLAGIGMPGDEFSIMQAKLLRSAPVNDEAAYDRFDRVMVDIASSSMLLPAKRTALTKHFESVRPVLRSMLPEGSDVGAFIARQVANATSPWEQFFVKYNTLDDLERVRVPVLALNGSKDIQVPARINQDGMRRALERGGNTDVQIRELPGLNHMFQKCTRCTMDEYPEIEQTMSPAVLRAIADWILQRR